MFADQATRFKDILGVLHKHEIIKGMTPVKLREIIEDLGPTFIKLGQIMSMHSEILPKEYCQELMQLRSNVAPMPFEQVVQTLETAYGQPVSDVFQELQEKPLGAASIAQVHKATLMDGSKVVVKVQRQGIYDTMARDIALLHKGTKLLRYNSSLGAVNFDQVLDEMWVVAQEEMNFLMEAANLEEFNRLNEEVVFVCNPKLYRQYTTTQVLVMEYIEGYSIDDTKALLENGYDLSEVGNKMADNYVKQIMDDGFFHADPHPGNIRIRDGKIVWIDMGMMGRLNNRDRQLLSDMIVGVAHNDVNEVKDALVSIGDIKGKIDHHQLYMDIDEILTKYVNLDLGNLNLSVVMEDILEAMSRNNIGIPGNLTMLVRGLTTAEEVVAGLSPDINVITIVSNRANAQLWKDFDLKKEIKKNGRVIYQSGKKALAIPGMASDILKMFMKGQNRLNLDLHATEDLSKLLSRLVRNIVIGLVVSSLLIGSSILCVTNMKPKLLGIPALGAIGYLIALILAILVLLEHHSRHGRK